MVLRWVPNYCDPDTSSLCRTLIHHCNYALVSTQAGARSECGERTAWGGSPPSGGCDVWRQHRGGRYLYLMSDVVCFLFFCTTRETLKLTLRTTSLSNQTHYGKALFINASLGGNSAEIFFRLLFISFLWERERVPSFSFRASLAGDAGSSDGGKWRCCIFFDPSVAF